MAAAAVVVVGGGGSSVVSAVFSVVRASIAVADSASLHSLALSAAVYAAVAAAVALAIAVEAPNTDNIMSDLNCSVRFPDKSVGFPDKSVAVLVASLIRFSTLFLPITVPWLVESGSMRASLLVLAESDITLSLSWERVFSWLLSGPTTSLDSGRPTPSLDSGRPTPDSAAVL